MASTEPANGADNAAPAPAAPRPQMSPEQMAKMWKQRETVMASIQRTTPKVDFSQDYDANKLKGRSVLITGGSTGIGKGCTEAFAEAGAYVTIADINAETAEAVEKELTGKGYHVKFVQCDVTSWSSLVNAFKTAVSFSPNNTIDLVIPNAGLASGGNWLWLAETPLDSNGDPTPPPAKIVDVNYMAVYNTAHLAIYYFKSHPGTDHSYAKQIIFVSSMAGYTSMHGVMDYGSSKWAVRGLFRTLKDMPLFLGEGLPKFRVNLIAPGWVRTAMTAAITEHLKKSGQTIAEVSDVVHVALRMAVDDEVQGRACVILANKSSFDLCDDPEGGDAGRELHTPHARKLFGWQTPEDKVNEQVKEATEVVKEATEQGAGQ